MCAALLDTVALLVVHAALDDTVPLLADRVALLDRRVALLVRNVLDDTVALLVVRADLLVRNALVLIRGINLFASLWNKYMRFYSHRCQVPPFEYLP